MKKRLQFECWNCQKIFSLLLDLDEKPDILLECPYCSKSVLIEQEPHREKIISLFKSDNQQQTQTQAIKSYPEIIPTRKPDEE